MNLNLAPEVNEIYLPRISQRLRSQGMLKNACNCNTCGNCSTSTSRWLRGISRSARPSGYYQQQTYGNRYPIYSRPYGNRFVHLLADAQNADGAQAPAIVDVNVQTANHADTPVEPMPVPSNDDAGAQGADADELFEFEAQGIENSPNNQYLSIIASASLPDKTPNVKNLIAKADRRLQAQSIKTVSLRPMWIDAGIYNAFKPVAKTALKGAGLYMLSWPNKKAPTERMNYLGMASEQSLLERITQHETNNKTLHSSNPIGPARLDQVRVYVWKIHDVQASPIRHAERCYLNAIANQSGKNPPIKQQFLDKGFANSTREFEFNFSN